MASRSALLRWCATAAGAFATALVLMVTQSGCLAVGYSSGSGWFVWPGGIGLVVLILLVLLLMRRRR
ncbi:MAG TPA: DUF3309 family protein [Acidisarcina sp.]